MLCRKKHKEKISMRSKEQIDEIMEIYHYAIRNLHNKKRDNTK